MPGSCLMIGLKGFSLSQEEKNFILSYQPAGCVLFKRNIQSFKQIHALCLELKSLNNPPLLIAIDMEGGEVDRFSHLKDSFTWPSAQALSCLKPKQVFLLAKEMGRWLYLLGFDINFAPVVDSLLTNSPLLKNRVFGSSKKEILKFAEPFAKGLIEGGVLACLKHFPGHGGVSEDSHKTLPKDFRSLKKLKPQLEIFKSLFLKYPCGIMTAHIEFSLIDKKPATFSKIILKSLLRKNMGFKGLLISDDIDMQALKNFSPGERFFYAIKGGCDLIIACQNLNSPKEIIKYFQKNPKKKEEIKKELARSKRKLLKMRKKANSTSFDFQTVQKELIKSKNKIKTCLASF